MGARSVAILLLLFVIVACQARQETISDSDWAARYCADLCAGKDTINFRNNSPGQVSIYVNVYCSCMNDKITSFETPANSTPLSTEYPKVETKCAGSHCNITVTTSTETTIYPPLNMTVRPAYCQFVCSDAEPIRHFFQDVKNGSANIAPRGCYFFNGNQEIQIGEIVNLSILPNSEATVFVFNRSKGAIPNNKSYIHIATATNLFWSIPMRDVTDYERECGQLIVNESYG